MSDRGRYRKPALQHSLSMAAVLATCVAASASTYDCLRPGQQSPDDARYAGTLLTYQNSALPKGAFGNQTYFYNVHVNGIYDSTGKYQKIPSADQQVITPGFVYGFTDNFSAGIYPTLLRNSSIAGSGSAEMGDLQLRGIYQLNRPDFCSTMPTIAFQIRQNMPTGNYENGLPSRADMVGAGVFSTSASLLLQKEFVVPWTGRQLRVRFDSDLIFADHDASVHGFNTYGGGYNTSGKVAIGTSINEILGFEYSMTKEFVLGLDLSYTYQGRSSFSGFNGFSDAGLTQLANVGSPSNWSFVVAPQIEYNLALTRFSFGVLTAVAGRNSARFVAPVFTYSVLFP